MNRSDLGVQWRVMLGLSAFVAVMGGVYWFASYEQAGTTLLILSAGLSLLTGGWLYRQDRHPAAPAGPHPAGDIAPYLPHASPWPLVVGIGAAVAFNGMILGLAYGAPGAVVIAAGLAGLARQSRHRH